MEKNEIQDLVDSLNPRLERLRALYEQYFMGIERIPPATLRKDIDRAFWRLRRERFNNTALRFRFQQILQRYNVYKQHWMRIMREIERGTYRRTVARAARRFDKETLRGVAGKAGVSAAERHAASVAEDEAPTPPRGMATSEIDQLAQAATTALLGQPGPAPAAAAPPTAAPPTAAPPTAAPPTAAPPTAAGPRLRPPTPAGAGRTENPTPARGDETRALYDKLIAARRAQGDPNANLSYDKLRRSLDKQRQQLQRKHGSDKRIAFEVIDRGGKAMIRPVVKNE